MWHHKDEGEWAHTPLEDIRVDVHLKDGVTTMPLTMLVDLLYPLIAERMDAALATKVCASLPSTVNIDGKTIAKIMTGS